MRKKWHERRSLSKSDCLLLQQENGERVRVEERQQVG